MAQSPPGPLLLRRLHLGLAITLIALPAAFLAGWALDITELFTWYNEENPLLAADAIGFMTLGLAFFAIELGWRQAGLFAILPALVSLHQTLTDASTDLSQHIHPAGAPAVSAPIPTSCFIITCIILPLAAHKNLRPNPPMLLALGGSLLVAIGGSTLLGYMLGLPAVYHWGTESHLAPAAAILLMLTGSLCLNLGWRLHHAGSTGSPD